ncbi:hypothetical protein [Aeromicrobium sp. IC_218]|uniref:hypothetical protein n=1 Tax=Aeromicrobium sp. IC_218 TaxID=2545468 RepID=UPI001038D459|nr:hypothetical protein [Aeromicrobium sp. IC_218]TCI97397.1 hypothetical protein E0W78_12560 [Aeromicrobium sp. IC_218]
MFISAILDLRGAPNWDPTHLTGNAFRWPSTNPAVRVGDLATRLAPRSFAAAGSPVVTPANVDGTTGSIKRRSKQYQGSVYQAGSELRSGDVLVPRAGTGPALLVSERLRGALISPHFAALRPVDKQFGIWLWAVMSSDSGRQLRASLGRGVSRTAVDIPALFDAQVPVPPLAGLHALMEPLHAVEATTHREEAEAIETWWQTTDLRATEWRLALAIPDASILSNGSALRDFCGEIVRGKDTRSHALGAETPGYLPVADVSMLGGKAPRRWVPGDAGNPTVAYPGDLMVAGLGKLPHARIADAPLVADNHVFVLRLRNPGVGPALAHYLNGQDAYRLRQLFLTGTTIPSISVADLARIPVPESALELPEEPSAPLPLSERLEQVLWTS